MFADGVRRLFKRRNNSAATYLNDPKQQQQQEVECEEEEGLRVVVDYDLTGLTLRVPKRVAMADSRKVSRFDPFKV